MEQSFCQHIRCSPLRSRHGLRRNRSNVSLSSECVPVCLPRCSQGQRNIAKQDEAHRAPAAPEIFRGRSHHSYCGADSGQPRSAPRSQPAYLGTEHPVRQARGLAQVDSDDRAWSRCARRCPLKRVHDRNDCINRHAIGNVLDVGSTPTTKKPSPKRRRLPDVRAGRPACSRTSRPCRPCQPRP